MKINKYFLLDNLHVRNVFNFFMIAGVGKCLLDFYDVTLITFHFQAIVFGLYLCFVTAMQLSKVADWFRYQGSRLQFFHPIKINIENNAYRREKDIPYYEKQKSITLNWGGAALIAPAQSDVHNMMSRSI